MPTSLTVRTSCQPSWTVSYTATADKQNAKLVVKFSGESRVEIGDANSDKNVDARDVKAITDYMIGNGPEKFSTKAADMNNDTLFNIADIIQNVNQILSKEQNDSFRVK